MDVSNKHVVPRENDWAVKAAGANRATRRFSKKAEAIDYANELAAKHNVCVVVHDKTGKFEGFDCEPEMVERNQHVVSRGAKWAVLPAGHSKLSAVFDSKEEAMTHAYNLAADKEVCMVVHNKNGKFESVSCGTAKERLFKDTISAEEEKQGNSLFAKARNALFGEPPRCIKCGTTVKSQSHICAEIKCP